MEAKPIVGGCREADGGFCNGLNPSYARLLLRGGTTCSIVEPEKPRDAHAWLDTASVEVTAYPVAENFAEIACFV